MNVSAAQDIRKEKKRQRDRAYYQKNRDKIVAHVREYNHKHAEQNRKKAREYYWKNRERVLARYYGNREKDLARSKAWKQAHKQRHSAHARDYYRRHIDYIKEYAKRYRKAHPEVHAAVIQKRRALQRKATINLKHIKAWIASVKSKLRAVCYYCQKCVPTTHIHFDHIVPIAKGGAHSVENLCVACRDCNHSKYTKSVRQWVRTGQQVLEL